MNSVFISVLWPKMLLAEICGRARPWQRAPPAAWPPPAKFIDVRNRGEPAGTLVGARTELMKCQAVSWFAAASTLLPLIWSFGGKGCN